MHQTAGMNLREGVPAYLLALAATAAAVFLRWLLEPWLQGSLPLVTLFASVAFAVWLGGHRPALFAVVLGYVACAYLFIEPRGGLGLDSLRSLVGVGAYLLTCGIIIGLGEGMRTAQRQARERREPLAITLKTIHVGRGVWPGVALVAAASLALLALGMYQAFWNAPELQRSREMVVHTLEVIALTRSIERAVVDAADGMRSYLVTGDEMKLARYRATTAEIPGLYSRLAELTDDNPEQRRRMPVLEQAIAARLAELDAEYEASEREGLDAGRKLARSHVATGTASVVRRVLDAAIATENELLALRQARAAAREREVAVGGVIGGVLALAVLALGSAVLLYAFRSLSRSEQERREGEAFTGRLVEEHPDALLVVDSGGSIVRANPQADTIFGHAPGTLVGQNIAALLPVGVRPKHGAHVSSFFATPRRRPMGIGLALSARRTDGTEFPVEILLSPLHTNRGDLAIAVVRDVSERQRQQEALENARALLAQSQKVEALGQLTGGIAHDFNNFLQVILGSLETIRRLLQSGDRDVGRFLDAARRSGEGAANLTRQLLAFARRQPLEPRPIDPNKLVIGMVDLLKRTLGESISVQMVAGAGVWLVSADANQLESALLNLALNARDAMPDGGKLTIETSNAYIDEAYAATRGEIQPGPYVMIAVSDTGVGMTKEIAAKAFEPFFTTKEIGRGTGLGLSQVYGFIKQSSGHVAIYSEPGAGTTVKIYLPRLATAAINEPLIERGAAPAGGEETILLVEDDQDVRTFVAGVLVGAGYRVLEAGEAGLALQLLDAEPNVELLLTDVGLPNGMNGKQLAEEARRRRPSLEVLFMTGYARNAIVHQGRLDPGVELITKPFTEADLVRRVRNVLAHRETTSAELEELV